MWDLSSLTRGQTHDQQGSTLKMWIWRSRRVDILQSRQKACIHHQASALLPLTLFSCLVSLVAQVVKHLPAMQETWVQPLCLEEPLEKGMATHTGILAWRTPWAEESGGLPSMGSQELDTTEQLTHTKIVSMVVHFWGMKLVCSCKWTYFINKKVKLF